MFPDQNILYVEIFSKVDALLLNLVRREAIWSSIGNRKVLSTWDFLTVIDFRNGKTWTKLSFLKGMGVGNAGNVPLYL